MNKLIIQSYQLSSDLTFFFCWFYDCLKNSCQNATQEFCDKSFVCVMSHSYINHRVQTVFWLVSKQKSKKSHGTHYSNCMETHLNPNDVTLKKDKRVVQRLSPAGKIVIIKMKQQRHHSELTTLKTKQLCFRFCLRRH